MDVPTLPPLNRRHRPLLVWLIDDATENHDAVTATVAGLHGVRLVGFFSGHGAVAAHRRACGPHGRRQPDIILMDFFLGDERGDRVTRAIRAQEGVHRAVIVGYSSSQTCSEAIVAAGGDAIIRKLSVAPQGHNPDLRAYLQQVLAIRSQGHRPRTPSETPATLKA